MDNFLLQICFIMSLKTNNQQDACINSIKSIYIQSGAQNFNNLASKYYEKQAYNILGKDVIYAGLVLGAMEDSYQHKEIHFTAPIRPLAESLSLNLSQTSYSYSLNWKWEF